MLDVGSDVTSFVRKMKATQKMSASGLCMLCVVSGNFRRFVEIVASLYARAYSNQQRLFQSHRESKGPQKTKEKASPAGPKKEHDTKQKDTNTHKDAAKVHSGLLPKFVFPALC